jgi:hypothetical protein
LQLSAGKWLRFKKIQRLKRADQHALSLLSDPEQGYQPVEPEPGETYSQMYISMLTQNAPVACAAVTVRLAATSCWPIRELAKPTGITPPA